MGITAIVGDHRQFIASWRGFRDFSDALDEIGADQFPVLNSQLPDGDEGYTSLDNAKSMLVEIARFKQLTHVVDKAVLVDTERNQDVSVGSHILGGALSMDRVSGYDLGFDRDGFFVRDRWELNRILFRAMRVEQRVLHPELNRVEYVNRDTEQSFVCNVPFGKIMAGDDGMPRAYLQFFEIQLRSTSPERYAYILGPLERIIDLAIKEQQPIHWA